MSDRGRDRERHASDTTGGKRRVNSPSPADEDDELTEEEELEQSEIKDDEPDSSREEDAENKDERWTDIEPLNPTIELVGDTGLIANPARMPVAKVVQPCGPSIRLQNVGVRTMESTLCQISDRVPTNHVVRPEKTHQWEELAQFTTVTSVELQMIKNNVKNRVQIGEELFEFDPVHPWAGHPPYSTGRPSVIIHVSPTSERGTSLAFLERRLRDEYRQRRGGEPVGKHVGFIGGKPNIPAISGNIVTFDLTADVYSVSSDAGKIRVERNGTDVLEYVEDSVRTAYTGELGYLILNVPTGWQDPFVYEDVFERLHDRLAPEGVDGDGAVTDDSRFRPIVTRCQWGPETEVWDEAKFTKTTKRYWFGSGEVDSESTTAPTEAWEEAFDRELRRYDWLRTTLTEQDDSESDEHYLLKGAITAKIARLLYEESGSDEELSQYVFDELYSDGPLETEAKHEGKKRIDIRVSTSPPYHRAAIKSLTPLTRMSPDTKIAIEVETGRSEAATNFRKFWKTIDRLCEDEGTNLDWVLVAIPSRLLMHTRGQARHILNLAKRWNEKVEESDQDDPKAKIVVPQFARGEGCVRLHSGEVFFEEVYDNG